MPKEESNAYVNAALFDLPREGGVDILPYSIAIFNGRGTLTGSSSVQMDFSYRLTRDSSLETGAFDHKVLLQIVDDATGVSFDREIGIDELSEGSHTINYSLNGSIFSNKLGGSFRLNVYDLFQGHKRLISTQTYGYVPPPLSVD
ncbi:hypothetical protein [Cohnella kolymensis]|uniref:hypothetical protein n=1 Tax=Cohnella kolymensis TaxID=1590652 RepID=UPI001269C971|nr:hypothetical protein [Cohnella kolymensis]